MVGSLEESGGGGEPTAKDVARDPTALTVDTVDVSPKIIDLKVGETLDLAQILSIKATNAAGTVLRDIYFNAQLMVGEGFVSIEGSKLTGLAAGTAALSISASTTVGRPPPV